jgi:hypothetical protein
MHQLTKKDQPWKLDLIHQKSFNMIKERFGHTPDLHLPEPEKPFALATDASKWATRAILLQKDINRECHPC